MDMNSPETQHRAMHLVMDTGKLLLENGGEVFRVQQTMQIMASSLGIEDFNTYVVTNGIFASANDCNEVRHIPSVSIHLARVEALNELSRELAAEDEKLEKGKQAVSKFLQVSRLNCEEQLKILQRLEDLVPEPIPAPAPAPIPPAQPEPEPAAEEPQAEAPDGAEEAAQEELHLEEDFFTMPLPTLEDIKKVQAKQPDLPEAAEEDVAANVQAAMDELAVEETSLWDDLPEDATRVIKLDDLQFGRNYKKGKD